MKGKDKGRDESDSYMTVRIGVIGTITHCEVHNYLIFVKCSMTMCEDIHTMVAWGCEWGPRVLQKWHSKAGTIQGLGGLCIPV